MKAKSADRRIVDYRRSLQTVLEALPPEEAADLVEETVQKKVRNFSEGGFDMTYRIVRIEPAGP